MKFLLSLLLIVSLSAFAEPDRRLANLVDTLSETPASLSGNVSISSDLILGQDKVDLGILKPTAGIKWKANRAISFSLSENELYLGTDEAFLLKLSGLTFRVKNIRYSKNGRFQVDIDSPVMEKTMEAKLAAAIESRFKAKMDEAFKELTLIRHQKSGKEAQQIVNHILDIFKNPSGPGLFDNVQVRGDVALNFDFPHAKTLQVNDKYVAEVHEGDNLSAGGSFTRTNGKINITELQFNSSKGIVFHPAGKSEEDLATLKVMSLTISDRGIEPVMVTGAEETLSGFKALLTLLSTAQGVTAFGTSIDCDPRIKGFQDYLQQQLHGQLIPLIHQHRTALIKAGIDPHVLDALEG